MDGRDEAHKEWLKQRQKMLNELDDTYELLYRLQLELSDAKKSIHKAIKFIKQGEI